MGNYSQDRLEEKIYKIISLLLVSNKLYSLPVDAFVTVRRVELSTDNKNATVYYTFLGDEAKGGKVQKALEHSSGIIGKSLAEGMKTKNTPHLTFKRDLVLEKAVNVDAILSSLEDENK